MILSKRNFATKYAFCSNFQNLKYYLADFLKILENLQKIAKFAKFANFTSFAKKMLIFAKIAFLFCQILKTFKNLAR